MRNARLRTALAIFVLVALSSVSARATIYNSRYNPPQKKAVTHYKSQHAGGLHRPGPAHHAVTPMGKKKNDYAKLNR